MNKILDIDDQIEGALYHIKLGQPLEAAFPKLRDHDAFHSFTHLKHAMNWVWLQTHKGLSQEEKNNAAGHIARRSLAFARQRGTSRDMHDYVLLNLAILVGDQELIQEVVGFVHEAQVNVSESQYWRAQIGILRCRILGEVAEAKQQYEIMNLCKGKQPAVRAAAKPVLRSLVAGDGKAMQRQIKSVTTQYWKWMHENMRIPVVRTDRDVKFGVWDSNRFWPWPEAAILKLMARGGAEIEADAFWLPKQLISA